MKFPEKIDLLSKISGETRTDLAIKFRVSYEYFIGLYREQRECSSKNNDIADEMILKYLYKFNYSKLLLKNKQKEYIRNIKLP